MTISRELLSAIIGLHIYNCKPVRQTTIIRYVFDAIGEKRDSSINIHELAFKCKEWALSKGYSYVGNNGLLNIYSGDNKMVAITNDKIGYYFDVNIDFIACEWILKEITK